MWAALLHDVGKPSAKRFNEMRGDYVFYGHPEVGTELARARLSALRFSNDEIEFACHLIREHMFVHMSQVTSKAVRRWRMRLGPVPAREATQFMLADMRATDLDLSFRKPIKELLRTLWRTQRDGVPCKINELAVGGKDLIALGLSPGPRFSEILSKLLDIVMDDPLKNEHDVLLAEARRLSEEQPQ